MKKLKGKLVLALGLSLLWISPVLAISLDFVPSTQTVGLGAFDVDVVISGLDNANEVVSAYDIDVTYDPLFLSATGVFFGGFLGDPFFFETFQDFDLSTPGVVDFAELSLLSDANLDAMQPDKFTLATLTFNATAIGESSLDFVWNANNDIKGREAKVLDISSTPGSVSAVPEPATILLVGSGLVGLAGLVKRRRNKVKKKL